MDFVDFPASYDTLLAFAESFRAPKSVLNALASLKHFHLDADLALAQGVATHLSAPTLTLELLAQLCHLSLRLGEGGVVFAALLSFAFAPMARLSSLLP